MFADARTSRRKNWQLLAYLLHAQRALSRSAKDAGFVTAA